MDYYENQLQRMLERFIFSLKCYPANQEVCYQDCLKAMDRFFRRFDNHDDLSKRLMNRIVWFKKRARYVYLGF